MLTYIQVHLYYLFPPTLALIALYWPLIGRRDVLIISWLCFMATAYTTAWDNWIISQAGWGYPAGSIIGKIFFVPIEEHIFFVVQPIFLVLLHSILTHGRLLPFDRPRPTLSLTPYLKHGHSSLAQTLPRRPIASLFWVAAFLLGAVLVNEAHQTIPGWTPNALAYGKQAFYLGWILLWISPVIGWLTWLGGKLGRQAWKVWAIGSAFMCAVDTIAIRNGAWSISAATSLDIEVVRGLPLEEFIFFLVTSYLVVIAAGMITHLHALLILSPELPPCPPLNPIAHIILLARVALDPPYIDAELVTALHDAEETLRKGSKSFTVAKLAFGREMRIGLIAVYAWCRVTDDLIDEPQSHDIKLRTLASIRRHLRAAFDSDNTEDLRDILNDIPHLSPSGRSAFHLFATLIPRLVPVEPFLELCDGYETDMAFVQPAQGEQALSVMFDPTFDLAAHLPIKTTPDLLRYADDVAGSIAAAICYLSWSLLTAPVDPAHATRPVEALDWAVHVGAPAKSHLGVTRGMLTVEKAREMGRALQLVNISRDIAKDALIGRLYIPISLFTSSKAIMAVLRSGKDRPPHAPYTTALLDMADTMRISSIPATAFLPRTARGGTRAMVASYFEIAGAVRRNHGEVYDTGIRVAKWRRGLAAAKAFWLGVA